MSQVLYQIEPHEFRGFLEQISAAQATILAAAPVDSQGQFLDDGSWTTEQELMGIPVTVTTLDPRSLNSLRSDLDNGLYEVLCAPAIQSPDTYRWYITHTTATEAATLIEQLHALTAQVLTVAPDLEVHQPPNMDQVIVGATAIPAALADIDNWPEYDLTSALRTLAELNYQAHRTAGHGKSWEPGFQIRRRAEQWTITFRTYQFDDPYRPEPHHVFTGSWSEVTAQIHTATDTFAQTHKVARIGCGLETHHPLSRLSTDELLNLPDNVELHLSPGHLSATGGHGSARTLLDRFTAGLNTGELIAFARYATSVAPHNSTVAEAIAWRGDQGFEEY